MKNLKLNHIYLLLFILCLFGTSACCPDCGENSYQCEDGDDCPSCLVCDQGTCVDPCEEVECPEAYICYKGTCVFISECKDVYCPPGQACYMGQCYRFETE
jgi:hypothetical protein